MLRTFVEHRVRTVESLDGLWAFVPDCERKDTAKLPSKYTRDVVTPVAWETLPGLEQYRGTGWMKRNFTVTGDKPIRLAFGGVLHTATVFIDGKKVGKHYDGFVPWDLIVTGLKAGEHELVIEINNTFGKHSALHVRGDHYSSGGIIRPAELQEVSPLFIDKIRATPKLARGKWGLGVRVLLRNVGRKAETRRVVVSVAGKELDLGEVIMAGKSSLEVAGKLTALKVKPWSADKPELYTLTAQLFDGDEPVDDKIDRVGFREIKVSGSKLMLNGKQIFLRGYNRHEYHAQHGQSLPVEVMARDVRMLKDLGCNFIRTSHYPNDMRMLDLCDEFGIYVWEETNSTSVGFKHPKYNEQITACAETMVGWHFNHPAIIIWASLNECDAKTKSGRAEHGRMMKLLRDLDGSRLVTYASCAWKDDICLDHPDIVSWNWYTAWYWGSIDTIRESVDDLLKWQDTKSKGKGKPVIISEFGAGAFYGFRSQERGKWTEEYQAEALGALLDVYCTHERIAGVAMWQFNDVRISHQEDWGPRPRCINNKGTVDEFHRPKLAYDSVKKSMHAAKRKLG